MIFRHVEVKEVSNLNPSPKGADLRAPFFSSDFRFLGHFLGHYLRKIPHRTLCKGYWRRGRESHGGEKKKGIGPFSITLFHNLIFIDAGNECKSGLNEMNLSGGVNEAHGEDLAFKPFRLPVHPAGCVHLEDFDFGHKLNYGVGFLPGWGLARLGLFLVVNQWFRKYPVLTRP